MRSSGNEKDCVRRMPLSKEKEQLLLLSGVNPEAPVIERAQSLLTSNFNWDIFIDLSVKHGTSAIIYKNLLKLDNIPANIIDKFSNIYTNSLRANILMVSELDRVIDMLNKADVEVVSLKGATVSEKIFGDIAVYPSGDIDILVKVKDIDRVRAILEADGYKLNSVGFDQYKDFFIKELYSISFSKEKFTVEPHWNLFMRYFKTLPEFWWEESIIISSGGRQYRFLSPEKNILYTSFRLFSHAFNCLRFLSIVSEIVKHYRNDIDWNKLFVYAEQLKFDNVLSVVLRLSSQLLGTPIPAKYVEIKDPRTKKLYKYSLKLLMQDKTCDNNSETMYKVFLTFLSRDLLCTFKMFIQRAFPSMGEIVSRYELRSGSCKAVAYYVLNPILLLLRRYK